MQDNEFHDIYIQSWRPYSGSEGMRSREFVILVWYITLPSHTAFVHNDILDRQNTCLPEQSSPQITWHMAEVEHSWWAVRNPVAQNVRCEIGRSPHLAFRAPQRLAVGRGCLPIYLHPTHPPPQPRSQLMHLAWTRIIWWTETKGGIPRLQILHHHAFTAI